MAGTYNEKQCDERHVNVNDWQHEKDGELKRIWKILTGNGDIGLVGRVDRIEQILVRQQSVFWRLVTPAIPTLYFAVGVGVWYMLSKYMQS